MTKTKVDEDRLLTEFRPNSHAMATQWGVLQYKTWCYKESARINKAGGRTAVVHTSKDESAIIDKARTEGS